VPDLIALGEPMAEFAAQEEGRLGAATLFRRGWGGDTANVAVAAARLGTTAGYITRLGGDEFGRSFLDLWARDGVDASRVIVEADGFTGVYFIALAPDGTHDFTYYRAGSAASRLRPEDIDVDYLVGARVLHTSGITQAISNSARAAADRAIEVARAHRVTVSYDVNVRPKLRPLEEFRGIVEGTLPRADIVFLSQEDAAHLYGEIDAEAVLEGILAAGSRLAVLKLGDEGCLIASAAGERVRLPAWPVEAVDTTGAGDAFDAAFLTEWLRGEPLDRAGRFANAVGALTAQGVGAVAPIPGRAQVEAFLLERERSPAKGGSKA